DVIAVSPGARGGRLLAPPQRLVGGEHRARHLRERAAVEEDVRKRPDQPVIAVAEMKELQPVERRRRQIDAPNAVGAQELVEAARLLGGRLPAQVGLGDGDGDLGQHLLAGRRAAGWAGAACPPGSAPPDRGSRLLWALRLAA